MKKRNLLLFILLTLTVWCLSGHRASYGIETLPVYEPYDTNPYGIDGNYISGFLGHVVGGNTDVADHAFFYRIDTDTITLLDHPQATGSTRGDAIDGTRMVGFYAAPGGVYGFTCDINPDNPASSSWDTVNYGGGTQANGTHIYGIDGNYLVGRYLMPDTGMEAGFLYNGSQWETLIYPGATKVRAYDVDAGQQKVTGFYVDSRGRAHGFIYDMTLPPTDPAAWLSFNAPGTGGSTYAYGIDGTSIVGRYFYPQASKEVGFIYNWATGAWTNLDLSSTRTYVCGIQGNTVVGIYVDAAGKVQGFRTVIGAALAVTSFAINNGDSYTSSTTVTLNNTTSGSPTSYMASESISFSGATWEPYSTAPSFTLSAGSGVKTVYFKVTDGSAESPVVSDTITLSSEGPDIDVSQGDMSIPDNTGSFDFGSVPLLTDMQVTFTIQNLGDAPLNLTGSPLVMLSGENAADFLVTQQPDTTSIAPSGSTIFVISFRPQTAGVQSATVSILNDDGDENPYDFLITATGGTLSSAEMNVMQAGVTIPDNTGSFDFGSVQVGTTNQVTFSIENLGDSALNLTGSPRVSISGPNAAEYSVTTQPDSPVAGGGSTTFVVAFTPGAQGVSSATVSIANDDSDENPYDFAISGTGAAAGAPEMNVMQAGVTIPDNTGSFDFGSVQVRKRIRSTFTIENLGTAALNLTGSPLVAISGTNARDFRVTTQPVSPLAAGSSTTFVITFRPSAQGTKTATVSIANNDSDENPYNFAITGTGL